ncbi:MAG: transglycosylase SLT domain-containing protein [Bacteroidota bacterium]
MKSYKSETRLTRRGGNYVFVPAFLTKSIRGIGFLAILIGSHVFSDYFYPRGESSRGNESSLGYTSTYMPASISSASDYTLETERQPEAAYADVVEKPNVLITHANHTPKATESSRSLYLSDQASAYIQDIVGFQMKVSEVARMLDIPAEWLMSIISAESSFNPQAINRAGSGATGLIQFMPSTAADMNTTLSQIKQMDAMRQLDYVYHYLDKVRQRYGEYTSLTDTYLAVLYPKARQNDLCYVLFSKPSKKYTQNKGLDTNKDGRVTISDIDRRMQRLYSTAYTIKKK